MNAKYYVFVGQSTDQAGVYLSYEVLVPRDRWSYMSAAETDGIFRT
jgi:hypothetical protein